MRGARALKIDLRTTCKLGTPDTSLRGRSAQGLQVQTVLLFRLDLLVLRREDGYIPCNHDHKVHYVPHISQVASAM